MERIFARISTNVYQFFFQQTLKCINSSTNAKVNFLSKVFEWRAKNDSDTIQMVCFWKEGKDFIIQWMTKLITFSFSAKAKMLSRSYFIISFLTTHRNAILCHIKYFSTNKLLQFQIPLSNFKWVLLWR